MKASSATISSRFHRRGGAGALALAALLSLTACTTSVSQETATTEDSVVDDAVNGVGATSATEPGDLVFPFPKNLANLNRILPPVMTRFGANSMSAARIYSYASVAWYDTASPPGTTPFIASAVAGQSEEQGMLAAGAVIVELLGNPLVAELVDAWEGDLTEESSVVVDAVLAFAASDGFDATAGAVAPTFEGPLAWKAGGTRDATPGGYEPGYGAVQPIRLDLDACPVPAAPLAAISAEQAALTSIDLDVPAAVIVRPERYSLLILIYLGENLPEERLGELPVIGQVGNIMLHDALIATWRANWENGIAAPIDLVAEGNPLLMSSHPSYPSWTEVAVSSLEAYVGGILGRKVTFEEIVSEVEEIQSTNTGYLQQIADLTSTVAINRNKAHHWNADREAGRELGACIAGESLKVL